MRIAQINMFSYGSTGKIMLQIADRARQAGHEAYTFSTHTFSYKYERLPAPPEGHRYYGYFLENCLHYILSRIFGYNGCHSILGTYILVRRLKRMQIDVLHLHNLHSFCINFPILFNYIKKSGVRVVWTLHDCWTFTGHCPYFDIVDCEKWKTSCYQCPMHEHYPASKLDDSKPMYRKKKRWFTGVQDMTLVTPSDWLRDLTRQSFLQAYPAVTIHNGIDLSVFQPSPSDFRKRHGCEDKVVLLGVAFGWGRRKGLDVFIELAERLDSRFQIVLVGTDDVVDAQLPNGIISIHRTKDQAELARIYTAADLFVNPTREEVFGLVNAEALACGTPVVTFRSGGSPEVIDETCGVVVEKDDIEDLEQKIRWITDSRPFLEEACVNRAKAFDMNDRFREYVELYERIEKNEG